VKARAEFAPKGSCSWHIGLDVLDHRLKERE
jgi:hypothetical protein